MEQERLIRKLNSVGKEVFVRYYYLFRDFASDNVSRRSAIQRLVDENVSNEDGAWMRLGNARAIFNERGNCHALLLIQHSQRLSDRTITLARKIAKEDC